MNVLIGIIGYCGFVRAYPLGPELMSRLTAQCWPPGVELCELNWGPVAVVQQLQGAARPPQRVVLIGAPDRQLPEGTVSCRRWAGGTLDPALIQERMFEAVTGVISLDNLLVIGTQFQVWPAQTCTVELQWPTSGFGDLVLQELEQVRGTGRVLGEQPMNEATCVAVDSLARHAVRLALHGPDEWMPLLRMQDLAPVAPVLHHRFARGHRYA